MKRIGKHAIVIGASMGGASGRPRAGESFYGTVTVLERDAFPAADIPRKGVPQGRHAHGLLARGRNVIEELLPGLDRRGRRGRRRLFGDIASDVNWIGHGVQHQGGPERSGRACWRPSGARRPCSAPAAALAECAR